MKKRKLWVSIIAGALAAAMLLSLVLSLIPTTASAASSSEIKQQINTLKSQKEDLQTQMEDIQSQYEENEDEIANMVNEKNLIDQEIFVLNEQIDNINQQLSAYAVLIADKQDELDDARDRLDELNGKYKERIRAMEEDGSISYWSVLFKANSFSDLLDRLDMIEEIAASDQRRLQELSAAAEEVATAQDELEAEKEELQLTKDELDETQAVLDEKRAEADALLTELIAKGYELEELYAEYEQAENDILDEIAAKEQEYNEAKRQEYIAYMATYTTVPPATTETTAGSGGSTTTSSGTASGGTGSSSSSATWLVPCSYTYMSSPFGDREQPTAGASTNHQGVDLAAPEGTPIYASRTGIVTTASHSSSAGYYVTINHGDGFSSVYMHMTRYVVSSGQAVSAGQLIGYVGSTGISTGNHLHFGITYNGKYVNPALYVNFY